MLHAVLDFILHVDVHLAELVSNYGAWTYGVLTAIVFCETGLIVTPFLPGDSLLFAAGALAATSTLDIRLLFVLLAAAAFLGDTVNYAAGAWFGTKLFDGRIPYLKQAQLDRTHAFFERYGGRAIVIARFVPIVRTIAPFVAGGGRMTYGHFAAYNAAGALLWISAMLLGGYFFGNIPIVRENFGLVVIAIIVLSLVPPVVEVVRARLASRRAASDSTIG